MSLSNFFKSFSNEKAEFVEIEEIIDNTYDLTEKNTKDYVKSFSTFTKKISDFIDISDSSPKSLNMEGSLLLTKAKFWIVLISYKISLLKAKYDMQKTFLDLFNESTIYTIDNKELYKKFFIKRCKNLFDSKSAIQLINSNPKNKKKLNSKTPLREIEKNYCYFLYFNDFFNFDFSTNTLNKKVEEKEEENEESDDEKKEKDNVKEKITKRKEKSSLNQKKDNKNAKKSLENKKKVNNKEPKHSLIDSFDEDEKEELKNNKKKEKENDSDLSDMEDTKIKNNRNNNKKPKKKQKPNIKNTKNNKRAASVVPRNRPTNKKGQSSKLFDSDSESEDSEDSPIIDKKKKKKEKPKAKGKSKPKKGNKSKKSRKKPSAESSSEQDDDTVSPKKKSILNKTDPSLSFVLDESLINNLSLDVGTSESGEEDEITKQLTQYEDQIAKELEMHDKRKSKAKSKK